MVSVVFSKTNNMAGHNCPLTGDISVVLRIRWAFCGLQQPQLKRCIKSFCDPGWVKPWTCKSLTYKTNETAYPQITNGFAKSFRILGQNIECMPKAHQVMISLHGIPIVGKAVFILVAVTLFYQKSGFYTPTVARTEVTTLVYIASVDGFAWNPGMERILGNNLVWVLGSWG